MAFGFLLVALLVTWCLPGASWAASPVTYVPYTMEDSCDGAARTIHIPSTGPGSAIIVRSHQGAHYKSGLTCHFIVKTNTGYRILVVFDALQFPGSQGNCSDSLLLSNAEDVNGPICSASTTKDVVSKENVLNLTWTTGGGTAASVNDGFEAIITAYKPGSRFCTFSEFKCDNHRCVADNLACDGHNNCGDNSDEKCDFGSTFWHSYATTVLMVGGLLLMGLCMVCPLLVRACNPRDDQAHMSRPNTPAAIPPVGSKQPGQPSTGTENSDTTTSTGSDKEGSGAEGKEVSNTVSAKKVPSRVSSKSRRSPTLRVLVPTPPSKKSPKENISKSHDHLHGRRSLKDVRRRLPKTLKLDPHAEPLSTTSYRCMRIPPGNTSSELPPHSPLHHAYDAAAASQARASALEKYGSSPSERPLLDDLELSTGYPASVSVVEALTTSFIEPPEPMRPAHTTPSLYVLRPLSSLSQDDNVECAIREVSCGLVRGPEFTPLKASTFQVVRRALPPPAEVHQPRRPRRFSFSRPASQSSRKSSRSTASPPPSSPSSPPGMQKGRENRGYCSD